MSHKEAPCDITRMSNVSRNVDAYIQEQEKKRLKKLHLCIISLSITESRSFCLRLRGC